MIQKMIKKTLLMTCRKVKAIYLCPRGVKQKKVRDAGHPLGADRSPADELERENPA